MSPGFPSGVFCGILPRVYTEFFLGISPVIASETSLGIISLFFPRFPLEISPELHSGIFSKTHCEITSLISPWI